MGFPDFPIPPQRSSYIPSGDVLAFLELYANNFRVTERIRFQHHVVCVRPLAESKWKVVVRDLPSDCIRTDIFDAIFVCNGHYHTGARCRICLDRIYTVASVCMTFDALMR